MVVEEPRYWVGSGSPVIGASGERGGGKVVRRGSGDRVAEEKVDVLDSDINTDNELREVVGIPADEFVVLTVRFDNVEDDRVEPLSVTSGLDDISVEEGGLWASAVNVPRNIKSNRAKCKAIIRTDKLLARILAISPI